MPLTFLTAESSAEQSPAVLPHEAPDPWMRPYQPGAYRVAGGALLLMLAAYLLVAALIVTLSMAYASALWMLGAAAAVIGLTVRLLRVGIWVSGRGLRQISLLATVTLPWEEVASVRTSQQPVKWLGLPRTVQGQAVLVTRTDGEVLRAVLTDHNADFLGRGEAFDRAADKVEDWFRPSPR